MGCDIHSFAEVKKNDKWQKVPDTIFPENEPFCNRSYALFGFLANVRNYSNSPYFPPKGIPINSHYLNHELEESSEHFDYQDTDYHNHSYLTLKELLAFDYDQLFENERNNNKVVKLKNFLIGTELFDTIKILKTLGSPDSVRVVFYFDN